MRDFLKFGVKLLIQGFCQNMNVPVFVPSEIHKKICLRWSLQNIVDNQKIGRWPISKTLITILELVARKGIDMKCYYMYVRVLLAKRHNHQYFSYTCDGSVIIIWSRLVVAITLSSFHNIQILAFIHKGWPFTGIHEK